MFQLFLNKRECYWPHNFGKFIVLGILLGMATTSTYASTLDAYAAYRSVAGKIIPAQVGKSIERKLQDQGFVRGKTALHYPKLSASPLFYVDQNTNGGNPKKPLRIGNLTFSGQPELEKRSGIVAGIRANLRYRHSTGWGKYLDFDASASESISISSSDKIKGSAFTLCSVNYIQSWTYLDACYSEANNEKELSSSTVKSKQISLSRHFDLSNAKYSKASLGFQEINYGKYDQTSVTVGLKTLSQKRRVTIELKYGDQPSLPTQHSLKYSGKISSNFNFMRRSGQISFSAAKYGRSKIFGYDRNDTSQTVTLSTKVSKHIHVQLGYHKNTSSVDYYSDEYPILSLSFVN